MDAADIQNNRIRLDRFITMAQYGWHVFARELEHYDLADSMHMFCPQWNAAEDIDLGGFLVNVTPKTPYEPTFGDRMSDHWHRQIAQIKKWGKPFDFWGVFQSRKRAKGPGWEMFSCQMPPDEFEYMMREVGDLFLGWEIGEFDGLYGRDVAYYWREEERPKTRREAHDRMIAYLRDMHEKLHRNTNALCGATFAHYYNEIPVRMIGAEVAQALLNHQVYASFLRGACRQYGFQYRLMASVFSRWGHNCYTDSGPQRQPTEDGIGAWAAGPHWGHSIGLLNAIWVIGYFAEAAIVGLDGSFYSDELLNGVRQLSPLGKAFMEYTEWSRNPIPRGRQIRPIALMLDYYAGWAPPKHLYSFEDRVVWHSIPYGPSDHGMDRAYDTLYPGYAQSGFYKDERGFIAPTSTGDCADVLLSDAQEEAMRGYPVIWLISDEAPDSEFADKMRSYVSNGGHLILSGAPMLTFAGDWFGMEIRDDRVPSFHAVISRTGEEVREALFSVYPVDLPDSWEVYAETEAGRPVVAHTDFGNGKVSLLLADHGLTDNMTAPGFDLIEYLTYSPDPPYEMLHCIQRYVKSCVKEHMPVRVDGETVYWSVNELDDARYVVCLYNPGHDEWTGKVLAECGTGVLKEVNGPWVGAASVDGSTVTLAGNATAVFVLELSTSGDVQQCLFAT